MRWRSAMAAPNMQQSSMNLLAKEKREVEDEFGEAFIRLHLSAHTASGDLGTKPADAAAFQELLEAGRQISGVRCSNGYHLGANSDQKDG